MTKCPECRIAPLRAADGSCRYCERAKARVVPGAVPMDGVLKTFIVATVVANAAVFGFRAVVYALDYLAAGDVANGDLSAIDTIHMYARWMTVDWWATILSGVVLLRFQRRWMDAGNANALTQPGIGLGWFRDMPSSKAFQRWQWAQTFGYLAIVFLNIAFHNSASTVNQVRSWAVIEVTLCSGVIAASIAGAYAARDMTAQLVERIAASERAAQVERAAEPGLIA